MRIALLGPPGCGKGTQAEILCKTLAIAHISSGDLLRQAVASGTELGREAKGYMDSGKLVPDELVIGLIKTRVAQHDCEAGFLLDGFPRNREQAEKLDKGLVGEGLDCVVAIEVSEPSVIARLGGRRTCRQCSRLYHVTWNPPKVEGICDACGGELYTRDDDRESTIRERLVVYRKLTEPLMEYYAKAGLLRRVDGEAKPEEVSRRVTASLDGCRK